MNRIKRGGFLRKITVLKTNDNKKIFSPPFIASEKEKIGIIEVKNTQRALKKVKRVFCGETIIIESGKQKGDAFFNHTVKYEQYEYEKILPLLYKICIQAMKLKGIKIPSDDFYIISSPVLAKEIIEKVYSLSKIFTVISDEDLGGSVYDSLYYKYGVPVRQIPNFTNKIEESSVVVRCNRVTVPLFSRVPIIELSPVPEENAKTVFDVRKISIKDRQADTIIKLWGGTSGICFYELLGIFPQEDAEVCISKKADEIFLLDTNAF